MLDASFTKVLILIINIKENSRGSEETSGILHEHEYTLVLKFTNMGYLGGAGEIHEGRAGQGKAMFTKFKDLHTRKLHEGHSTCMPWKLHENTYTGS